MVRKLMATVETPLEIDGSVVYESAIVTVPVTIGWLRPRVVLPLEWREWSQEKLSAVLTHEGAHFRRHDGLVTALAAVNRCIFWFHPLAWILERRLALLAERACDEVCVAELGDNERYAKLLLEMANAGDGTGGRLRRHALTMAAGSHLRQRIESLLILEEGRAFSRGITRVGWTAVILCAIPLVVCAGAVQLEHPKPLIIRMPRWRVTTFAMQARESEMMSGMKFQTEDLRSAGLELVPVTSPGYEPLLKDIQQRLDNPIPEVAAWPELVRRIMFGKIDPARRDTSAILLNHSTKSIAMMELVWRYQEVGGRSYTRSRSDGSGRQILLPFSPPPATYSVADFRKIEAYWNTILPGSKRYVGEDRLVGDNTDARLPAPDEMWQRTGGGGIGNGAGSRFLQNPIQSVTLVLDGVFFTDGEFVGPDQFGLWESVTTEAQKRMAAAKTARDGKARGLPASAILDQVATIIGPVPDRPFAGPAGGSGSPDIAAVNARMDQRMLAEEFARLRQMNGDERRVDLLAAQADTKLPDFRKR